uniref:AAA family ATPase n=1 Tax=Thermofilum pendens TaxID=2269 RepID=A0A7J3X8K7_THEPE
MKPWSKKLYRALLKPPPQLLFREAQLREAEALLARGESFLIRGPQGVGKTTMAKLSSKKAGFETVYVPGFRCRTYNCLRGIVKKSALNIIDDYGLILRDSRVVELVRCLPFKIVITHTGLFSKELEGLREIVMPPYTEEEILGILEERVTRLSLPVSWRVLRGCAREAAVYSGNVRIALVMLADYLAEQLAGDPF